MGVVGPHPKVTPDHLRLPPRPTGAVPLDDLHEWLKRPLPADHPVLRSWETHFQQRMVPYARRVGPDQRVQLYVHKPATVTKERAPLRWCCS